MKAMLADSVKQRWTEWNGQCFVTFPHSFRRFFRRKGLQWRHNKCDGVSNHRRLDCLLNRLFRRRSKKSSKLLVKPLSHQGGVLTATARRARKTQNAEVRAVRSHRAPRDRRGIAVASPLDAVGSPRTPCHGAHFVHAQSARRGLAFPRRSEWQRSNSAVRSPRAPRGRRAHAVGTHMIAARTPPYTTINTGMQWRD